MTEVAQEMLCNRSSICVSRVFCCEAYGGCGADTKPVCTVGYMQHPALVAGDDEAVHTEQVSGGRRSHAPSTALAGEYADGGLVCRTELAI